MKTISTVRASPDTLRFLRRVVAAQSPSPHATRLMPASHHQIRCISNHTQTATFQCRHSPSCRGNTRSLSSSARHATDLPSNPQTHYDFFPATLPGGPPPSGPFAVDLKQLRNEFLRLQASAHPDRHPPERKASAEALSARINEAYKTLQSPLLRAQYLLSLRGNESPTDDAAKLGDAAEDQELLMEVLELREQIEEAETEDQIRDIKEENDVRITESVKLLQYAFENDKVAEAAKEAVKLRYWVNVDETLHAWEEGKPAPLLNH